MNTSGILQLIKGDITKIAVDAIVNAADNILSGGGGVDEAIHKAGGPIIVEECKIIREQRGGCPTGEAVITRAGNLAAKFVIHTVGPVWNGGLNEEEKLLRNCYRNALQLAVENNVSTISFPNISTGIYNFPKKLAAAIAVSEVQNFLETNDRISKVMFICFNDENFKLYKNLLKGAVI